MKKTIAAIGSRSFSNYKYFKNILDKIEIKQIVSGGAKGADSLAEKYSNENNIPIVIHKPNWKKYGKAAGFIRNKYIIENSDIIIAFWDGKSKGTKHSINIAKKLNKDCRIILIEETLNNAF